MEVKKGKTILDGKCRLSVGLVGNPAYVAIQHVFILTQSSLPFLELKREATARAEIRDKIKEEQRIEATVKEEPEKTEHSETIPATAVNSSNN